MKHRGFMPLVRSLLSVSLRGGRLQVEQHEAVLYRRGNRTQWLSLVRLRFASPVPYSPLGTTVGIHDGHSSSIP